MVIPRVTASRAMGFFANNMVEFISGLPLPFLFVCGFSLKLVTAFVI